MTPLAIYAACATAAAAWAWLKAHRRHRDYLAATGAMLLLLAATAQKPKPEKSPHQRAAETRAKRRLEEQRAHRIAFAARIAAEKAGQA